MIDFSRNIKNLRETRHMTQSDLARALGVTKSMISSYETATRSPSYEVLIKIARFFNVSMDYMFGFCSDRYINVNGLTDKEKNLILGIVEQFKENKKE